jgi:hypothetical protein
VAALHGTRASAEQRLTMVEAAGDEDEHGAERESHADG